MARAAIGPGCARRAVTLAAAVAGYVMNSGVATSALGDDIMVMGSAVAVETACAMGSVVRG